MLIKIFFYLLGLFVLLIGIGLGLIFVTPETFYLKNKESYQKTVSPSKNTEKEPKSGKFQVLNQEGKLNFIGYTTSNENFYFDHSRVSPSTTITPLRFLNSLRVKRWEALVFTSENIVFSIALFDVGYIGGYFFHYSTDIKTPNSTHFIEYVNPRYKPTIYDNCFNDCTLGSFNFPFNPLKFANFTKSANGNIFIQFNLEGKHSLTLDLKLVGKDYDSMVTFTPMIEDTTLFYFNTKVNTLKPLGDIKINGEKFDASKFLVTYDSGKGAWPVKSGWVWVNGNGYDTNGRAIGLNLGHGFSEPKVSLSTEDCFVVDGKLNKLSAMKTELIGNKWIIGSKTKKKSSCNLEYNILQSAILDKDFIFAKVKFRVYYGVFNGECYDESGLTYAINNLSGLIEHKLSVW